MKLSEKHILVTGGAGFIGSNFVSAIAKDNRVTVLDNFASSVVTLNYLNTIKNVTAIRGDILDDKKLDSVMPGIDVVVHFAVACVRISLSRPRHTHDVNATGTLNTLLAAKKSSSQTLHLYLIK